MIGGHRFVHENAAAFRLDLGEPFFEIGNDAVGEFAGALIIAAPLDLIKFVAGGIELLLEFLFRAEFVLFGVPARGQRGGFLLKPGKFTTELFQAILRGGICLLFQGLLLDLELNDPAVEFVELFRLRVDLHAQARGRFVDEVDCLVGKKPVGDIAVRQRRGGDDRGIGDAHAMVQFVFFLETAQNRDGVGDGWLGDEHRLEAARQRGILFDMLAIFVERGRTDAMELAPRESRLQEVRCVHRAIRLAGANERVHFVDE